MNTENRKLAARVRRQTWINRILFVAVVITSVAAAGFFINAQLSQSRTDQINKETLGILERTYTQLPEPTAAIAQIDPLNVGKDICPPQQPDKNTGIYGVYIESIDYRGKRSHHVWYSTKVTNSTHNNRNNCVVQNKMSYDEAKELQAQWGELLVKMYTDNTNNILSQLPAGIDTVHITLERTFELADFDRNGQRLPN